MHKICWIFMFACEFVKLLSKYGENDSRQKERIRRIFKMNKMRRKCWRRRGRGKTTTPSRAGLLYFLLPALCAFTMPVCLVCVRYGSWQSAQNKIQAPELYLVFYLCERSPSVWIFVWRCKIQWKSWNENWAWRTMPRQWQITTDCNFIINIMREARETRCVCVCVRSKTYKHLYRDLA